MTLEAYLRYDEASDTRHELVNGVLVKMPPESRLNEQIALWLFTQFLRFVPIEQLSLKAEVVVAGSRATARIPDLMVLTEELAAILRDVSRSTVTLDMPPPALVVEVVSPGKENADRDYRYKRSEYGVREIAEYWIVDPVQGQVVVLRWVNGLYEEAVYREDGVIESSLFPELEVTAAQVLQAGA